MTAVLVFDRDGDAMAFATEEETAGYLEAVDVESGEYAAAYLGDGTVLRLLTPRGQNGPCWCWHGREGPGRAAGRDPGLPAHEGLGRRTP